MRALQRRALNGVHVHGGECRVVVLARPDADHALDGLDEDLAVTDLAGAGRRQDGLDARLHEWLRAHHLDLDLLVELHDDRGAAVLAHDLLLAPVAAHATEADPRDAGLEQRRLDFGQAFGPNDGCDEFHDGKTSPCGTGCQRNRASDARMQHHSVIPYPQHTICRRRNCASYALWSYHHPGRVSHFGRGRARNPLPFRTLVPLWSTSAPPPGGPYAWDRSQSRDGWSLRPVRRWERAGATPPEARGVLDRVRVRLRLGRREERHHSGGCEPRKRPHRVHQAGRRPEQEGATRWRSECLDEKRKWRHLHTRERLGRGVLLS